MSRYRWALRPRWILSHLFVLLCIVAFVALGLWQVRRLEERRASNAVIEARELQAPVPAAQLVPRGAGTEQLSEAAFRQVTVTGTWRVDDEVLIRNRTNKGAPGFWVVTPVQLEGGDAVVVNRGWVPLQIGEAPDRSVYAAPSGTVTVTGLLRESQVPGALETPDPPQGRLPVLSHVDVGRLQAQLDPPLLPAYVDLRQAEPAQPGIWPQPVPPPVLDDGPHLNYAGQWFIFAAMTAIVYPLLLRRHARLREQGTVDRPDGATGDGADGGAGEGPAGTSPAGPAPAAPEAAAP